ncbi:MAG: hypothetical protein AAB263_14265 [Planctomycetota bacterium]
MRIRSLVPALACLAAAPFTYAADGDVKLNGFVDTRLSIADTKQDGRGALTGFSYFAKLGLDYKVNSNISGTVDITNSSYTSNTLVVHQAYGAIKINEETSVKTGAFISSIGAVAHYQPDQWRPTAGIVPVMYGVNTMVGAELTRKINKDITLNAAVSNGFFGEGQGQTQQATGQKDAALAYLVDVSVGLNDLGKMGFELVYDLDAASEAQPDPSFAGAEYRGGNGTHLGFNAELNLAKDKSLQGLFEVIYQQVKTGKDIAGAGGANQKRIGLLAEVKYDVPNCPWHSNLVGSFQYVKHTAVGFIDGDDEKTTEVAVAMNTHPFAGSKSFGLNGEIAYQKTTGQGSITADTKTATFTLEALYVFP